MAFLMKSILLITTTAILSVTQATADITVRDVWDGLRAFYTSTGFEIRATETRLGKELRVRDLMLYKTFTEGDHKRIVQISLSLPSLSFTKNNNGTVTIILPKLIPIRLQVDASNGHSFDLQIDYRQNNGIIIVSGQSQKLLYNYAAETTHLETKKIIVDGFDTSVLGLKAILKANKVHASAVLQENTELQFSQTLSIDKLSYIAEMLLPEVPDSTFTLSGSVTDLSFESDTKIPFTGGWHDVMTLIIEKARFESSTTYGSANLEFVSRENGKAGSYSANSLATSSELTLDKKYLLYSSGSSQKALSIQHDNLPFPISLTLKKLSTQFMLPLTIDTKPKAFKLRLNLNQLTISDILWSIFNDKNILPKVPFSFILDLSGNTRTIINIFDRSAFSKLDYQNNMPLELQNVVVEKFHLSGVGAALTATGGFEFDNNDLVTFTGIPRPTGHLEVDMDGGFALLDRLIEMELVPKAQAMGIRMMLPMFTIPGNSNDVLKTLLEITDDGHILANGKRLQ